MSVLNWIASQFDYLFFIQGVPATPTVTAKTTTTTKTFIGNGTTEMIYYKEYFAVHTGVLPTMTIWELSLLWETKDSSFIEQVRDHFLLSYPWMNSQSCFVSSLRGTAPQSMINKFTSLVDLDPSLRTTFAFPPGRNSIKMLQF